ncbi:uncharacterized protein LOC110107218 [Dendrobium catenatum]|uniref:Small ribosomal subunit protein mS38 n=1 Tax=Dendrobium catenatum TaxID=906689 RepID=A0A2I0XJ15_9ASPA|nr:uncharacterized protein LOC110107218 [Dendrobium catenatum]PKU87884.1 hypothetical protein MA16_Dca013099 [Dendrobium catenatum]
MASLLPKLLRKCQPSSLQTLSFLSKSQPRTTVLRTPILSLNPDLFLEPTAGPISCFFDNDAAETAPFRFYPSFPHFSNLEPFSLCGNIQSEKKKSDAESDYASESDYRTVWADSVKKKRKRKMNKHKYRKLKKRLRRQT